VRKGRKRNYFSIKRRLTNFLSKSKFFIIFAILAIIVGIIIASLIMANFNLKFGADRLAYQFFGDNFQKIFGFGSVFFTSFWKMLLVILICFLLSLNKISKFFVYIVLVFVGYYFGKIITGSILIFGAASSFHIIVFLVPIILLNSICLILINATFYNLTKNNRVVVKNKRFSKQSKNNFFLMLIFVVVLIIILSILNAALLPSYMRGMV
jgi:hypothetical protein